MPWSIVQCARIECSRYMLTRAGSKRKKCPYCGRSFKVSDNYIKTVQTQDEARVIVKKLNQQS